MYLQIEYLQMDKVSDRRNLRISNKEGYYRANNGLRFELMVQFFGDEAKKHDDSIAVLFPRKIDPDLLYFGSLQ